MSDKSENVALSAFVQKAQENAAKPQASIEAQAGALFVSAQVSDARKYARDVCPEYAQAEDNAKAANRAKNDALNIHVPEAALTMSQAREARGILREGNAGIKEVSQIVKTPPENIGVLAEQYKRALSALKEREREISGKKD